MMPAHYVLSANNPSRDSYLFIHFLKKSNYGDYRIHICTKKTVRVDSMWFVVLCVLFSDNPDSTPTLGQCFGHWFKIGSQCWVSSVLFRGPTLAQFWLTIIIPALDQQRSNIRYHWWANVGPTVFYVQCIYLSAEENYISTFLLTLF